MGKLRDLIIIRIQELIEEHNTRELPNEKRKRILAIKNNVEILKKSNEWDRECEDKFGRFLNDCAN